MSSSRRAGVAALLIARSNSRRLRRASRRLRMALASDMVFEPSLSCYSYSSTSNPSNSKLTRTTDDHQGLFLIAETVPAPFHGTFPRGRSAGPHPSLVGCTVCRGCAALVRGAAGWGSGRAHPYLVGCTVGRGCDGRVGGAAGRRWGGRGVQPGGGGAGGRGFGRQGGSAGGRLGGWPVRARRRPARSTRGRRHAERFRRPDRIGGRRRRSCRPARARPRPERARCPAPGRCRSDPVRARSRAWRRPP